MSGFVGDLSSRQEEVLERFKENVKDVLRPDQGDSFLLRWLRARDFDAKKAEIMLRDALQWRKQMGADTILNDYVPIEVLEKYRTGGLLGRDKTGCPIYIDPYGLVDTKGLLRSVKKHDIMRKFVHVMETVAVMCKEESKKRNIMVDQLTVIYDLKSIGVNHMWKPAVDTYLSIVDAAESKFPEVLKRVFVINSPKIFPVIWSIVRPLLHENTAKKVVVLTGNYKDALLKEIDSDQLPACYGGTLTDPDGDPRCKSHICQGGPIPKEYYSQLEPHVDMISASIGRGSTLQLEYETHKPNSILRYEFLTEGYDIGFGVFRKSSKERLKAEEMDVVLSTTRSNSHLVPEDGAIICNKPGLYVVRFDNTYSWARSKKVHYLIEVLESEDTSNGYVENKDGVESIHISTENVEESVDTSEVKDSDVTNLESQFIAL